jgi:hypothetical protein
MLCCITCASCSLHQVNCSYKKDCTLPCKPTKMVRFLFPLTGGGIPPPVEWLLPLAQHVAMPRIEG